VKVWVFQQTSTVTHVCFELPSAVSGDLVLHTAGISGLPTVTPVAAADCPVYLHVVDPVDAVLRLGVTTGNPSVLCVGTGTTAIGVRVATGTVSVGPGVELWLGRWSPLVMLWCGTVNPAAEGCAAFTDVRVL
jgi:hypothetical protein